MACYIQTIESENLKMNKNINTKHYESAVYTPFPNCITLVRHICDRAKLPFQSDIFALGNAVKHVYRAGLKNDNALEDYKNALWYMEEIMRTGDVGDNEEMEYTNEDFKTNFFDALQEKNYYTAKMMLIGQIDWLEKTES